MPANDTGASTTLQQYLARLDAALGRLSASERREILLETQSHVADQAERSPMQSVPEILAELGTPESYARTFLVDPDATAASPRRPGALQGLARLATGSWMALPMLVFVVCCYSVAVLMLLIAIAKIQEPANTGFFIEHSAAGREVSFGVSDPRFATKGPDVLGLWIIPITVGIATLIHLAMRALLRRVIPRESTTRLPTPAPPPPRQ